MLNDKNNIDMKQISPLNLAFLGDGVFDLLVRDYLIRTSDKKVGELNREKISLVNCKAQSESIKSLMNMLTEEETDIFKRGRNTKVNSASKHGSLSDYHNATGFECLLGYLYLEGKTDRINEIFEYIIKAHENSSKTEVNN